MKTRDVVLGVVLVALVSGLVWQAYQRGRWKSQVEDLQAEAVVTDGLLEDYAQDSTLWASQDSLRTAREARLSQDSARQAEALQIALEAQEEANSAIQALRDRVDEDTLSVPLQDLLQGERKAARMAQEGQTACIALLGTSQSQLSSCRASQAVDSIRIGGLERLRSRLVAERDSAMALLKPPSLFDPTFELGTGFGCVLAPTGRSLCGFSAQVTLLRVRFRFF